MLQRASQSCEGQSIQKPEARNGCVKTNNATGAGVGTTSLPIVSVKVKCLDSPRVITTYAFWDPGSNTTFCTDELLDQLGVQGEKTTLHVTRLQNENLATECTTISLSIFDLDENNMVTEHLLDQPIAC